jgi:hypothetical protein
MATPLRTFTAWTRPNSKEFLIHLNSKVLAAARAACIVVSSRPSQANDAFETTKDAVVHTSLRVSAGLGAMHFKVAGSITVTFSLYFSVITAIGTLAAILNPAENFFDKT